MKDHVDIISTMLYNISSSSLNKTIGIFFVLATTRIIIVTYTHAHTNIFIAFTESALYILLKTMLQLIILRTLAIDNRTSPFFVFLLTDPHFVEGS